MIKNYLKIGWRNISRNKVYSVINILGLALGICACIVIYLIASYELSFDRFHPDADRIYRITGELERATGEKDFLNSPVPDVAAFQHSIAGFEDKAAIFFYNAKVSIVNKNEPVKNFDSRNDIVVTEPQYFNIFKYNWLAGNANNALNEPYKVVLVESKAHKYFGDIPADKMIGKTVVYNDSLQVSVAGIAKDWEQNTDFGYTDFISLNTTPNSFLKNEIPANDWSSLSPHRSMAFVKLNKGVTDAQINARFAAFIKKNVKIPSGGKLTMRLQPLTDIHFTKDFHRADDGDNFRKPYMPTLYALAGIALFILILAAVNFINLSTAQSIQRAKEIGIRKVLGGKKSGLALQFLTETFLLTVFAALMAIAFVNPVLAAFNSYIPQEIKFNLFSPRTLLFLLAVTVTTSLLAGFYPAKVLSAYLPVLSLKGAAYKKGTGQWNLRKGLIVFQFTISLVFIIGAIVISNQIKFMNDADKGFNTDAVITLYNWNDHSGKLKVFAENIKQLPGISKVLLQGTAPMGFAQNIDNFSYKEKDGLNLQIAVQIGNDEYVPFYKMKLLAGRNMLHSDSLNELLINETFSRSLGFTRPQDAVGKLLYTQPNSVNTAPYPIVGVVADFHTGSFHELIQPVVIENVAARKQSVAIRLAADEKNVSDVKAILAKVENEWKKIFSETPFEYSFLNESIAWLNDQEKKTAKLVNIAMVIAIFISCMGLFGLVMFTAELKTKEIGIRKVLGASVASIAAMLSKDFIILVSIAVLIASPLAWYFTSRWLQDFAYRTNINWMVFALAGLAAIFIALITVSFKAIQAATANPVESLRTE